MCLYLGVNVNPKNLKCQEPLKQTCINTTDPYMIRLLLKETILMFNSTLV